MVSPLQSESARKPREDYMSESTSLQRTGKLSLNVLRQSPHDQTDCKPDAVTVTDEAEHWVPSHYNVRATDDDGRLILWNTMSNALSVFKAEQAPHIVSLLKKHGFISRKQGLAGYLIQRGYLVRQGTNEYRKFLFEFGRQHYQNDRLELIVMSSEDCNFRCKYCYEEFARGTMVPAVRQGIKRFVEQRIERLSSLSVSWFGGEPLYGWPAIEDLGPFFRDIARKHDIPYSSHMTTNGYLMTPQSVDELFAWEVRAYQITLDGVPETHDCNRPTRDGRGTFWTILENLKAMSRRPEQFSVTLRVNFDQTNHGRMDEFLEIVEKELGKDSRFVLDFHAVGRWGGPNDPNLEVCGGDETARISAELRNAAGKRGLRFRTLKDVNYLGSQVCYAARPYNFLIGASGKVMKCTVALDMDERNVVGRIHEDGQMELDVDKVARWTEPSFQTDSQCQKCVVLPRCQGISCPLPRIENGSRPCISTRTQAKAELIEAVTHSSRQHERTRQIRQQRRPEGGGMHAAGDHAEQPSAPHES
jgi:uncharacterized protein